MFITKKQYIKIKLDITWLEFRISILEKLLSDLPNDIQQVLDNNQAIIDINKIVLDKMEEYLKVNDHEE